MTVKDYHEQQFFDALNDIFIGAKIEGESGYINLMHIKSRYYREGVFPQLKKDIDEAVKDFPDFREELFDKLYSFFQRYFSESGSIYFRYTPLHQNIYEKVYTDERDVVLFWKTHMLYYVKTDRLFKSLAVEVDGVKFWFDASALEHKRANEKREVIFGYREKRADDTLVFEVGYSERGRITKQEDILKALKKEGVELSDETLNKAFRIFEKQSEVDFFINKDARAFLREQFDLWMYQYLFEGQNVWSEQRLAQLQALKAIAYKVIDFISQFEDELVKIWNKPKFVRNSHYVVTIDRIIASPATADTANSDTPVIANSATPVIASPAGAKQSSVEGEEIASSGTERPRNDIVARLLAHPNMPQQVEEWRDLGMIGEDFRLEMLTQEDLTGAPLNPQYQHLPIDTKYFADLELDILALFDDLDAALDGWLIKSENYQALNTILPKFREKVQTIYIDPPFNTGEDFDYVDKYQDSSWLTLMENRMTLAKQFIFKTGGLVLHLDWNANYLGRYLMESVFGKENFINEVIWRIGWVSGYKTQVDAFVRNHDSLYIYAKSSRKDFYFRKSESVIPYISYSRNTISNELNSIFKKWGIKENEIKNIKLSIKDKENKVYKIGLETKAGKYNIEDTWNCSEYEDLHSNKIKRNAKEYTPHGSEITQKPEQLLERIIKLTSDEEQIIFDFFSGSGTTLAVSQKLNRKWLGVEIATYFDTDILFRMKQVLAGYGKNEPTGITKAVNYQGGGFFKYYELEQYEDVLRLAHYKDATLFHDPSQDTYNAYVFRPDLKLLESLEADAETNTVHFHPECLYPDPAKPSGTSIDLAETLSHLRGKWIKRITAEYVEFEDGEQMSLTDPDWQTLKPMIWWQ